MSVDTLDPHSMSTLIDLAIFEEVQLNAASFSLSTALFITLNTQKTKNIQTLIDSGASDNFIDSRFAFNNGFPICNLKKLLQLSLFNGLTASHGLIIQYTMFDVNFPCG